jgi:hypothetical protein
LAQKKLVSVQEEIGVSSLLGRNWCQFIFRPEEIGVSSFFDQEEIGVKKKLVSVHFSTKKKLVSEEIGVSLSCRLCGTRYDENGAEFW